MAEAKISVAQDKFSCPICQDLLKDPVTIPCGHSYCMSCITDCWNKKDKCRVYSCPQCRKTFSPRPALNKNVMFTEMVEELKKKKDQMAQSLSYAEPGDVECDVCTGRKRKAIKSCLICLESYCQTHFKCHEESHSSKRHKLTDAGRIKEMICSKHNRLLEAFCRTDQKCICLICVMDEHRNHDTVSAEAERTEKQNQVGEMQEKCQQRIQEREEKLQELREAIKTHKRSAQAAVKDSEMIFNELIRSIRRSRSEVIQMIRNQEKAEVNRAEGLLKQLEQEIDDLRRRDAELQQFLHTDDYIHFLESFQSLAEPMESTVAPRVAVSSVLPYDDVRKSVSHLKEILEEKIERLSGQVTYINIISNNEPRTKEEFLQYSLQLTLDPNTLHKQLRLSEDKRVATYTHTEQPYPDHPDRFDVWPQVLCRERVCGRCYWEVEWSGGVGISVSYKSICRKGETKDCLFGYKNESWKLQCSQSSCLFLHNNIKTNLPIFPSSSRIGVYMDHRAGILSFYSISDTMTLIHRIQTTFTQPLYPGFRIYLRSMVKLCNLRVD